MRNDACILVRARYLLRLAMYATRMFALRVLTFSSNANVVIACRRARDATYAKRAYRML